MLEQKKNKLYSRVKEICNAHNLDIIRNSGRNLQFPVYATKQLLETSIEALELDVRAYNCLKRFGIHTIGDLVSNIRSNSDLKKIRNCGNNSAANIMDALFTYQYEILDADMKAEFFEEVIRMNSSSRATKS